MLVALPRIPRSGVSRAAMLSLSNIAPKGQFVARLNDQPHSLAYMMHTSLPACFGHGVPRYPSARLRVKAAKYEMGGAVEIPVRLRTNPAR